MDKSLLIPRIQDINRLHGDTNSSVEYQDITVSLPTEMVREIEKIARNTPYATVSSITYEIVKYAIETLHYKTNPKKKESALTDEEISFLNQGKKIAAIKAVRSRTGLGLREAKDLVEAYQK